MGAASPFLRSSLTVTFARSPSTCSRPWKRKVQLNPLGAGTRGQAQGAWRRRAGGAAHQRRGGARTLSPGLPGDPTGSSPHFLPRGSGPRVATPSAAPAEAERTHGRTGVARTRGRRAPGGLGGLGWSWLAGRGTPVPTTPAGQRAPSHCRCQSLEPLGGVKEVPAVPGSPEAAPARP